MNLDCTGQQLQLQGFGNGRRRVVVNFQGGPLSSDGGLVLLGEVERRRRIIERAQEFLAQPRGLQLDRDTDTLYLSSYFDWYAEDFEREAGSVLQYVARYAPDPVRAVLRERGDRIHVKIMDYDWALNDQKNGPRARRPISR